MDDLQFIYYLNNGIKFIMEHIKIMTARLTLPDAKFTATARM